MVTTRKPLFALTAADLMSQPALMVPQQMSLSGAARMLAQAQITGAAVVDDEGCCIGVLSASDFVYRARDRRPAETVESACTAWAILDDAEDTVDTVAQHMTRDPVKVPPGTTIGEIARMMVDARIHRVIVVDPDNRPLGIVSGTDILAAVARAYQMQDNEFATTTLDLAEPIDLANLETR